MSTPKNNQSQDGLKRGFNPIILMKFATFAYIPPASLPYSNAFYQNVRHFKHKHRLVLFSDEEKEDVLLLKGNPETVKYVRDGRGNIMPYAVSNLLFLTALRMAHQSNVTHMLYLEADSRVGRNNWDGIVFDEFVEHRGAITGGTVMVWNPSFGGRLAKIEFDRAMRQWTRSEPGRGPEIFCDGTSPFVYANGCASVIDVQWAVDSFGIDHTVDVAVRIRPWDMEIGQRLWSIHGP